MLLPAMVGVFGASVGMFNPLTVKAAKKIEQTKYADYSNTFIMSSGMISMLVCGFATHALIFRHDRRFIRQLATKALPRKIIRKLPINGIHK